MADQKFNFAQTCNLLSQYLKEKRSLQVVQPPPTTMNLLTNMEATTTTATATATTTTTTPSSSSISSKQLNIDLLPQFAENPEALLADQLVAAGSAAQMTIFYGSQVLVLNDLQAEKAREIMGFATKGSSKNNVVASGPNIVAKSQELIQKARPQAIALDLPIARKASLHKFLAKRKERVAAIAPYQVNHQRASSSKIDDQMSSKDQAEGQCSKQLELKLF